MDSLAETHAALAEIKERLRKAEAERDEAHVLRDATVAQYCERASVAEQRVAELEKERDVLFKGESAALNQRVERAEAEAERLREALRVCGRHLYDCCRTDIDWKLQMETHDQAVNAVARAERDEPGRKESAALSEEGK